MAEESGGSSSSSGTVKIPGLGPMKKTYVYAGVALVIGIVGYAYWTRSKGDDVVYLDPAELPYGEQLDPDASTTPGLEYNNDDDDDPTFGAPRSNIEWSDRAVTRLEWLGYDGQLVATTIGKYLARQGLTPAEQEMIRTIHGLIGRPPEGDYPIIAVPNPPGGGTTDPPPPTGNKPYVVFWNGRGVHDNPRWALAGGPEKWQETGWQNKANEWAAEHMPGGQNAVAITINGDAAWKAKKAEYTGS